MALIARLFNFIAGTDIKASEMNPELNQLVNAVNNKAEVGANNEFTGNNSFAGDSEFDGDAVFNGNINLAGTFSGTALNTLLDLVDPVGIPKFWMGTTAPSGHVLGVGSIGNTSSSATQRANADTERLYTHFWNNVADAEAPVTGGRGVSAAADFAANKPLTMPDPRGKCFVVLDNLGGTSLSSFPTGVPNNTKSTVLGGIFGAVMHILTELQLAPHNHPYSLVNLQSSASENGNDRYAPVSFSSQNTGSTGGGQPHNNTQLSMAIGLIYRL